MGPTASLLLKPRNPHAFQKCPQPLNPVNPSRPSHAAAPLAMALFAAARRAAASAAPLILRASASSGAHRGAALLRPLAAAAARPQPRAMPFSSAPATRPSSDAELISVIDSKIKYAEDCDDHDRVREPIPL